MEGKISYLDPAVEYMTVSKLRSLNKRAVKEISSAIAVNIPGQNKPALVLIPYQMFIDMQELILAFYGPTRSLEH